ncbi:MAG: sigma-54-dependent Fis family transcriptional regulator [Treponema sp.]|nr:sigma-54-dependent Fis family transcriptional regulator [Treponema sp.]
MKVKKVLFLFSSEELESWCRSQVGSEFELCSVGLHTIKAELENQKVVAVLAGFDDLDDITRLGLYSLVQEKYGTRLVFLYAGKTPSGFIKSNCPKAKFISVCGENRLLPMLLSTHASLGVRYDMRRADKKFRETCEFLADIAKAASCDVPILLLGESGVGKSWAANYIHQMSQRKKSPLIHLNMAEIHQEFLESTLFGTDKGAFTGAVDKSGLFEQANNGTLFLDEIADLDLSLQAKLLRVLETGKCRRVGSVHDHKFNTRLIFATNAKLPDLVRKGKFRQDLFYRINMFTIEVPPLRAHKQDIPGLAVLFAGTCNKKIDSLAVDKLCSYSWPGNIRELKNVITRASVFATGSTITEDLIQFGNTSDLPFA